MKHRLALLLLLLLFAPLMALAEMNIITLKHRSAEAILPLLQPVLEEGVRISGTGPSLIINSKPWQLEEVRTLVEQLDTPLQSLLISVIQGGDVNRSGIGGAVSGTLEQPRVRLYGTDKRGREAVSQQLRVIEGGWATISAGEAVPITRQTMTQSYHGTTTQQSIEYKDLQSGFEVRPRVNGEVVTLDIRPFRAKRSSAGGGVIEQQEIITTVSGRLGEWITIGGVHDERQGTGLGTVYATGRKRDTTNDVRLKVDRLPN